MNIYYSLEEFTIRRNSSEYTDVNKSAGELFLIATIGTFDGVHSGHCEILQHLLNVRDQINRESDERRSETIVITFNPHPRQILLGEKGSPGLLNTTEEKIERIAERGIDHMLIIPFTKEFAAQKGEEFINEVLNKTLHVKMVIIGYDHRFGAGRTGGFKELEESGKLLGFEVREIPAHQIDNSNISSTKIRSALANADLNTANRLLGYNYSLRGVVIHGDQRGRTIGYPTANLKVEDDKKFLPPVGVYAVRVMIKNHTDNHYYNQIFKGMMNIGYRPTFDGKNLSIEVHILDFNDDIYNDIVTVEFIERIRPEIKFSSVDALILQLKGDESRCRTIFQSDSVIQYTQTISRND